MILTKENKTVLHTLLPRPGLLTFKKAFVKLHLDYTHIINDQPYNATFHQKLELIQ